MSQQERKRYRLVSIKVDCYLISEEQIKPNDWMCDRNGVYRAPQIDGFIGFSKVIATTDGSIKELPSLRMSDCIRLLGNIIVDVTSIVDVEAEVEYEVLDMGLHGSAMSDKPTLKKDENGFVKIYQL